MIEETSINEFLKTKAGESLIQDIIAYSSANGLQMATPEGKGILYRHVPVAILPSKLSENGFNTAVSLAVLYNKLVDKTARDTEWLFHHLREAGGADEFTFRLLKIAEKVIKEGVTQQYMLGVLRSDYMMNEPGGIPLQVEINTIAASFGCLSTKTSELHHYLINRHENLYKSFFNIPSFNLPANNAMNGIAEGLAAAFQVYNEKESIVCFCVQAGETNLIDQRHLEFALWNNHKVKVKRFTLLDFATKGKLIEKSKDGKKVKVLYIKESETEMIEIAVVYFRSGYTPKDYPSEKEWEGRSVIESSHAVKCPSITYHLAGAKKVQQVLANKGEVERYISNAKEVKMIRESFAGLWELGDDMSAEAIAAVEDAKLNPTKYVIKPQREGGGNNIYDNEVRESLNKMEKHELNAYILMQRIFPKKQYSIMLRAGEVIVGPTLSELGIYSIFLHNGEKDYAPVVNKQVGHLLRTKLDGVNEGGVASGFAVLDSPLLL